jgi:hypothetical protein
MCESCCALFHRNKTKQYIQAKDLLERYFYKNPKLQATILYTGNDLDEDVKRLLQLRKCLQEAVSQYHKKTSSDTNVQNKEQMIPIQSDSIVVMLNTKSCRVFGESTEFEEFRSELLEFLMHSTTKQDSDSSAYCFFCSNFCCSSDAEVESDVKLGIKQAFNMNHLFSIPYFKYRLCNINTPEKKEMPIHICISMRHPFNNETTLLMIYIAMFMS